MTFTFGPRALLIAAVAAVLVTAGVAYAAIPDSNGLVQGCYSVNGQAQVDSGSTLRIIDPSSPNKDGQACKKDERAVTLAAKPALDALAGRVTTLEGQVATLQQLLSGVSRTTFQNKDTLLFSGMNVQIVNGEGSTDTTNGLGNLIVGYEHQLTSDPGSHNIVVGDSNNFPSYGGLVVGEGNVTEGPYASVTGGGENDAEGEASSVSGGHQNHATGFESAVNGGVQNHATGDDSAIGGGVQGTASGDTSSISGGVQGTASGDTSSISGGSQGTALGIEASVSGGSQNQAKGNSSSVSGGSGNHADGDFSSILGGSGHTVSTDHGTSP